MLIGLATAFSVAYLIVFVIKRMIKHEVKFVLDHYSGNDPNELYFLDLNVSAVTNGNIVTKYKVKLIAESEDYDLSEIIEVATAEEIPKAIKTLADRIDKHKDQIFMASD